MVREPERLVELAGAQVMASASLREDMDALRPLDARNAVHARCGRAGSDCTWPRVEECGTDVLTPRPRRGIVREDVRTPLRPARKSPKRRGGNVEIAKVSPADEAELGVGALGNAPVSIGSHARDDAEPV